METLNGQLVDRNFEPLLPEERDGLKRFAETYATFLSQFGIDALTLAAFQRDEDASSRVVVAQITAYRAQKQNGNGRKGGDIR